MRSFKITISYDGTHYGGWQIQPNAPTIQATLEHAIKGVTGVHSRTLASGRTDAGVHALAQVVAFKSQTKLSCDVLVRAINAHLPMDIRVLNVSEASMDFHPIGEAKHKRYRYMVQDGPIHDVFQRFYTWYIPRTLNVPSMQQAIRTIIGTHDFAAFQATGSERKSTIRTIDDASVSAFERNGFRQIAIEVSANGFLYNMMRNIAGSLVEIGQGKQDSGWLEAVVESRDRSKAGMTAPPQGLFLVDVTYDDASSIDGE